MRYSEDFSEQRELTPILSEPAALVSGQLSAGRGLSAPPIIVRVAGLPANALNPLSSPDIAALLQARTSLIEELDTIRESVVETIEARLTEFDAPTRRSLLAIKRDCFNHRPTRKYRGKPGWTALVSVAPQCAERLAILEDRLRDHDAAFAEIYEQKLTRERLHVLGLLHNADLVRGIAIGRPGLIRKARRKAPSLVASGCARPSAQRPAKWEESLLRFVTRAATKLSANSMLTPRALGSLRSSTAEGSVLEWSEAGRALSLVRIDRPYIEQFQALLFDHPAIRRRALVCWNDSVEEIEPGTFRFVRDRHWKLDPESGLLKYAELARVKVKFPESIRVPAFRAALADADQGLVYVDLLDRLGAEEDDEGEAEATLERLLSIGFLLLSPPWPTHEPWLERRIVDFLRPISNEAPELREIADALGELVALETSFAEASKPERQVADMQRAFVQLMQKTAPAAAVIDPATRATFYEDVLRTPVAESAMDRGIFTVDSSAADTMLSVVRSIARFDSLFHFRHDVAHTLAAWWRAHALDRREIPFHQLAKSFAPTWKTFLEFYESADDDPCRTWDPLSSPALADLNKHRVWIRSRFRELLESAPNKDFVSANSLAALVESLPDRYRPLVGVSVFCQPADAEGSQWVLNNINPGTGQYLSRVAPSLPGAHRDRFLDHLVARSTINVDGEEADLLEVKQPHLHLVRAHPPQTTRVLDLRGLHLGLPRERRVPLDELVVQADLHAETFRLVDSMGRRVLPVSLSTLPNAGLSNKLRFLMMFGVGETRSIFPTAWTRTEGGVTMSERLTCGNAVLRRKSWLVPVAELREHLAPHLGDPSTHQVVDTWRRRCGLPDACFFREQASCGKNKPQFLRFDSPSLCRLFIRSLHGTNAAAMSFSEALPVPSSYPEHPEGERRALELLIDQLSIRGLRGWSSEDGSGDNTERPGLSE